MNISLTSSSKRKAELPLQRTSDKKLHPSEQTIYDQAIRVFGDRLYENWITPQSTQNYLNRFFQVFKTDPDQCVNLALKFICRNVKPQSLGTIFPKELVMHPDFSIVTSVDIPFFAHVLTEAGCEPTPTENKSKAFRIVQEIRDHDNLLASTKRWLGWCLQLSKSRGLLIKAIGQCPENKYINNIIQNWCRKHEEQCVGENAEFWLDCWMSRAAHWEKATQGRDTWCMVDSFLKTQALEQVEILFKKKYVRFIQSYLRLNKQPIHRNRRELYSMTRMNPQIVKNLGAFGENILKLIIYSPILIANSNVLWIKWIVEELRKEHEPEYMIADLFEAIAKDAMPLSMINVFKILTDRELRLIVELLKEKGVIDQEFIRNMIPPFVSQPVRAFITKIASYAGLPAPHRPINRRFSLYIILP